MTSYALRDRAGPVELVYSSPVVAGGLTLSYASMLSWDDASRAAVGIYPIVEPGPIPDGKIAAGSTLQDKNGTIRRVWTLEDAPIVPDSVPASISKRQFFGALAATGKITEDEALAAMAGTIPPEMLAIIGTLPSDQQFAAKMLIAGASTFERANPLVSAFMAAQSMTSTQVDDLWRDGSAL